MTITSKRPVPNFQLASLPALLLLIAVIAYYLPWVSNRAAALSANAYDLAEWVSLPPTARAASIPLVATFLLRAVLVGLALLFGVQAKQSADRVVGRLYAFVALILAITLAPPLDFFRQLLQGEWNDVNHRQQFLLTLAALIALAAIAGLRVIAWRRVTLALAALTILCAIAGEVSALTMISTLGIPAPLGIGTITLIICVSAYAIVILTQRGDSDPNA